MNAVHMNRCVISMDDTAHEISQTTLLSLELVKQETPIGIGNWELLGWVCHGYWDLVVEILITNDLSMDLFWKNRFKNFEECRIPLGVSSLNFFATGYAYLDMQACESPTRNRMDWSITLKWCVAKLFHVDERCCHQNLFYRNLYLEMFHSTNSLYAAFWTSFGSVCYMLMEDDVLTHVRWFSCGIWGFTFNRDLLLSGFIYPL